MSIANVKLNFDRLNFLFIFSSLYDCNKIKNRLKQLSRKMVCLLCLKETDEAISTYGQSEVAGITREVIAKYFWFDVSRFFDFS